METLFGKNRWIYWLGMAVLIVAVVFVLKLRKSPAEFARQRLIWGDEALAAGKYEQAVVFYEAAIRKDPTLISAYFNRALAYEYVDEKKAVAAWDDYIRQAEKMPSQAEWLATAREHRAHLLAGPFVERALALAAAGDHARAREAFNRALAYDPGNLAALRAAAENEMAAGDAKAAAALYERALTIAPYSTKTKYRLALAYERFDKKKAAATWDEVLEMARTRADLTTDEIKEAARRRARLRAEGYGA